MASADAVPSSAMEVAVRVVLKDMTEGSVVLTGCRSPDEHTLSGFTDCGDDLNCLDL